MSYWINAFEISIDLYQLWMKRRKNRRKARYKRKLERMKKRLRSMEDCRNCKQYGSCPCGKRGHDNGTSIGYSIGECKDFEPKEESNDQS